MKVAAPAWKESPDQNPKEPVTRLEREAAPRSQRHLELLAKQEILQDQVVPAADSRPSRTDDQRKELKHRRRIALRPSPLLGPTFAPRQLRERELPREERVDGAHRLTLHIRADVRVDVQGNGHARVAQHL